MGPDEQPDEQPTHANQQNQVAAELAALSARVEALERELAQLRPQPTLRSQHAVAPPPPPLTPSPPPPPDFTRHLPTATSSLEDRIGAQLFSRIGIVALLIATTLFLKWAIDNHYIGNTGRIAAGLIAGTAIVLWSERFRRNGFHAFSYSLKAIGSGALYLSLWAAFQLYHLLPAGVALAAMILVTAWNAFMAWSQNSELLAAYALAGAFATPLLLSTGGDHEIFLFTYILAIDVATVALVRLKPWPRLLFGAFPATVAFFIAWYANWYGALGTDQPLAITTLFIALFFLTFLIPSLHANPAQSASASMADRAVRAARPSVVASSESTITEILLPLANAIFASLALYSVLQDAGHHDLLPWMAVLFAAIYLGLMRLRQSPTTSAIHLSLAVVFLTIAIPLKASGRWITIGWLAEGAALLWVASRLTQDLTIRVPHLCDGLIVDKPGSPPARWWGGTVGHRESDPLSHPSPSAPSAERILRKLAAAALTLGFLSLFLQPYFEDFKMLPAGMRPYLHETAFLNSHFATALFSLASFVVSTWIALHAPRHHDEATDKSPDQSPDQSPENSFPSWLEIAAASTIAFNLAAIVSVVRELELLWYNPTVYNPEGDLQKSLAISAFLMLYGAALLAAGFWRRSAFIRWQALILLVFTIAKTFLYDLRNLSQGYRVLSFLGLGALLMAISFVYQKDLLALRTPEPIAPPPPPSPEEANS
jgi:uncharacterized membrane protein